MRTRLLVVLAALGAVVVTAFAVPLALSTAEARTRELVANRQAHLQRFAGLAEDYVRTGAEGLVQEEVNAYHELYAEGVAVVSTRGISSSSTGTAPDDGRVSEAVNSVLRNQRPSTPDVLTSWGAESLVFAQSVGTGTQVNGAVVIAASTERARADIGARWSLIGLGVVTALVLFGVLAVSVSRWVLRPLDRLSHRIRTLADTLPFTPPPDRGAPASNGREEETGPPELRAHRRRAPVWVWPSSRPWSPANSGRLALAGTPGGGLTVRVDLPRAAGPAEDVAEDAAEGAGGASTAAPGTRAGRP